MNNKDLYNQERKKRWKMAKDKEPEAIGVICDILSTVSKSHIEYSRYDEIWFEKYNPSFPENEWVKGASDYVIEIEKQRYIYAEIKIKSQKFKKTVQGGMTKKGSYITPYGCESFYLDIVPVYKNMCEFVEKVCIDSNKFVIFFVNEKMEEVYAISLKEIKKLIKDGYRSKPICIFSEGYGTSTEYGAAPNYLIPVDATHKVDEGIKEYIQKYSTENFVVEIGESAFAHNKECVDIYNIENSVVEIDEPVFAHNKGFYHRQRLCKYVKHKPDNEIITFLNAEGAENAGYYRCKECNQNW